MSGTSSRMSSSTSGRGRRSTSTPERVSIRRWSPARSRSPSKPLASSHPLRGVLKAAAQDDDLFLQRFRLLLELADLAFVFSEASLVLGGHVTTSHCGRALAAHPTPALSASCGTLQA